VAVGRTAEAKIVVKNLSKTNTIYRVNIPKDIESFLSTTNITGQLPAE